MNGFRNWLARFMYGRYGMDALGNFMMWGSILGMLLSGFLHLPILNTIAVLTIGFAYFRIFSRDIPKRFGENQKFLSFRNRLFHGFAASDRERKDKEHAYFRCPSCKQKVRVPRGKGMIEIRCPKCSATFRKRT